MRRSGAWSRRALARCEYCRCPAQFATQSFTIEHIEPRDTGGETVLENLAWACFGCNGHKHTATHGIDLNLRRLLAARGLHPPHGR